jgi:hypothetical protein
MADPSFFTTPTGIAVIAGGSSFAAGLLGAFISSATMRATHRQRIAADESLAERKFDFDRQLASRKAEVDAALTEKKLALDRAFAAWKRQTDLAEQVLADFYEAREIIEAARSPGGFEGEGKTREREQWEGERDSSLLDSYFRTFERLNNRSEFFSQLRARRYRFLALFGAEATKPYDELFKIRAEIFVAMRMLVTTHRQRYEGSLPEDRKVWEMTVGWPHVTPDPIDARMAAVVETIEKICRPIIQAVAP